MYFVVISYGKRIQLISIGELQSRIYFLSFLAWRQMVPLFSSRYFAMKKLSSGLTDSSLLVHQKKLSSKLLLYF